ncbi:MULTISPECIES: response regulator transcription factor [Saccharopolyspora]|uniref:Response regulator transcription factor n=1 Tax=Saccharopolyspora elongata TaxID=2530387 RepID=A0A4R4YEW6_9PSEU|nr:response regulator transcription factor [Saccharopolyspora elongata]TDD43196.1 response regulator transcription factor [Saccharopolyspora elongata]
MSISVVIADDQEMVRTGFQLILEGQGDISVLGQAADGVEAVELVQRLKPDVCLMDIRMPNIDGLQATRQIRSRPELSGTRIVVVTTYDLDEYVYGALRAGANGFVLKNSGARLLAEAIRTAVDGESLVSPSITVRLLEQLNHWNVPGGGVAADELSMQERKIVVRVARGWTNSEIAADMFLSVSTIKSHLARIQDKLMMRNRVEIAAWAWEHGIVR